MMLLESPSPGAGVVAWKAWKKKLKSMPTSNSEVRHEIARAEKMITALSKPIVPLNEKQVRELFSN